MSKKRHISGHIMIKIQNAGKKENIPEALERKNQGSGIIMLSDFTTLELEINIIKILGESDFQPTIQPRYTSH